jgi:hypothetical protein
MFFLAFALPSLPLPLQINMLRHAVHDGVLSLSGRSLTILKPCATHLIAEGPLDLLESNLGLSAIPIMGFNSQE